MRRPNYSTTGRRVIFPPGAADQLSKLEEMTIVLVNGSSDCIVDQIEAEVLEFKNKNNQFKLILHKPSQSLDQRNLVQLRGEGTTLPNQSVPASHVHDPTTGNQSPRSDNEVSLSYLMCCTFQTTKGGRITYLTMKIFLDFYKLVSYLKICLFFNPFQIFFKNCILFKVDFLLHV